MHSISYHIILYYITLYRKTLEEWKGTGKAISPHALGYKGGGSYGESPTAPALGSR